MITKEQSGTKSCCFYASDFHLEMILLPYIKQRINKTKFIVLTETNLEETLKILLDRINFTEEEKKKILNIGWNNDYINKLKRINDNIENNKELTIFIIGDEEFNSIVKKSIKLNNNINIIDCFEVGKLNKNIKKMTEKYDNILNMTSLEG